MMGSNLKRHPLIGLEKSAINFLRTKNISIILRRKGNQRIRGHPDFYDTNGQGWEIKTICEQLSLSGRCLRRQIKFEPLQIKNFKNDDIIVMMKHFQKEPEIIIQFKYVKKLISPCGCLTFSKIPIDKIIRFDDETSRSGNQILRKGLNPFPRRLKGIMEAIRMKQTIVWHEECLKNMISSKERIKQEYDDVVKKINNIDNEILLRQIQIRKAKEQSKDGFDSERFCISEKKEK